MKFIKLAEIYKELEHITSGNKMRKILSDFLKKIPSKDIQAVSYLTLGEIASAYDDIVIGMADKMVLRAIDKASKKSEQDIKKEY